MNRLLFVLLILSGALNAQVKISGKVVTLDNKPLEVVEVTLLSDQSVPLKNQLTDENGEFTIEYLAGTFKLEISKFQDILYSKDLVLNDDVNLGTIQVNNKNILETVTIVKKNEIIERKIDRTVFSVEKTIGAAGGDALDALRITPGVLVQNNNIEMLGKSTVRVLIDDKMLELGQDDLSSLLKSIPADNIKSIEVITTPPAKYDAIGNSGLVNIKLKKAKKDSKSLSLGTSYLLRSYDDEGAVTSNFMYNEKKLSINSSLNYRDGAERFIYKDRINYPTEEWNSDQLFKRDYKRTNAVLSAEYAATPKWTFGAQYLGNFNKVFVDRPGNTLVTDEVTGELKKNIVSDTYVFQKPVLNSINLFNEIKLDTLGKKMTLNLDYFKSSNNDKRPYEGTSEVYNPDDIQYFKGININNQKTKHFSTKVDVELPNKLFNFSFGGKFSFLKTQNDITAFNSGLVDQPVTDMPLTNNEFDYDENIQALYVSGNKKFGNNVEVQMGLRMEATQTKSFNASLDESVSNDYTKLFPSLNISYSPRENSTFRFGYNKRIGRPNFTNLNPNITYVNPFLSLQGNPFLQPFFIDNFEVSYTYKKLESKLYYSIENNMYSQIGIPDSDNFTVNLTYRNMFNVKRYGLSELFTFNTFKWWTSNNTYILNYLTSEAVGIPADGVDGFYTSITSNNEFTLNKDKTLLYNLNLVFSPVATYGVNRMESSGSVSFTFQYLLLNKDLKISLRANDIFRTDKMRFGSTVNGVYRYGNYYSDSRYVQLTLNYRFGSSKVNVKNRETGNADERSRTGN